MGSRQRKRKAIRAQYESDRAAAEVSATPMMVMRTRVYERNNPARTKPAVKPAWVVDIESSGHQYIKGDRAPVVSQTRQQKQKNRSERKRLRSERDRQPGHAAVYGSKEGVSHPVRDARHDPTEGVQIKRGDDWNRVRKS